MMQRNTICIAKLTNSDVYNLFVAQGFQLFGITYVVFHGVTKPVVITFPPKIKIVFSHFNGLKFIRYNKWHSTRIEINACKADKEKKFAQIQQVSTMSEYY